MKLYMFDVNDLIVECKFIRETPTTYKYMYRNGNMLHTVKKDKVNTPLVYTSRGTIQKLIATSKKKLVEIAIETLRLEISKKSFEVKAMKLRKEKIMSKA